MLAGSLDTFTVQDIFRLIEATGQSGRLTVDGSAQGSFIFDAGKLHFADRPDGPGLPQRLAAAGAIRPDGWARATAGDEAIWDSLVAEGAALDTLAAMLREELEDVAEPLLSASDGSFEFVPSPVGSYGDLGFSVDEVLEGASERRQRWEVLAVAVRPGETVPALTAQLPDDSSEVTLVRSDWSIVSRCDGTRTVVEIAAALGRTHLVAAEAVARLISIGVVKLVSQPAEAKPEAVEPVAKVETKVEAKAEPKPEPEPEPKPEVAVEPEVEVEAKIEVEAAAEEAPAENKSVVATRDGAPKEASPERELVGAGAVSRAQRSAAINLISALARS